MNEKNERIDKDPLGALEKDPLGETPQEEARERDPAYEQALDRLLLEEYRHMGEAYLKNEELGERRVHVFIAITVAVVFSLAALGLIVLPVFSGKFVVLFTLGLGGVFLFGLVTLTQMVHRNTAADRYQAAMTLVRRRFVDRYDEDGLRSFAVDPYRRPPRHGLERIFSVGRGGTVESVAFINSVILGAIVTLLSLWLLMGSEARDASALQVVPYAIVGFSSLSLAWAAQIRHAMRNYDEGRRYPG
jgi:hypothetical protein